MGESLKWTDFQTRKTEKKNVGHNSIQPSLFEYYGYWLYIELYT